MRTICAVLAFSIAAPAFAQRTSIQLVEPGKKLTEPQVQHLMACRFTYKLRAGMTNAEAGDAIDTGWETFKKCLQSRAATPPVKK